MASIDGASNIGKEFIMSKKAHISRLSKPITYHKVLHDCFDDWASECGWEPNLLRRADASTSATACDNFC